jgi:hypothetical protein
MYFTYYFLKARFQDEDFTGDIPESRIRKEEGRFPGDG